MLLLENKMKMLILAVGNQKTTLKIGESFANKNIQQAVLWTCSPDEVNCVDFLEEGREHQEAAAHTHPLTSPQVNNNPMG